MKKELSLRNRLLKYLVGAKCHVSSGDLQKLTIQHTKHTARSAVRRLEELTEDGLLDVEYRGPHNHAFYKAKEGTAAPKTINPNHIQGTGYLPSYDELEARGTFA